MKDFNRSILKIFLSFDWLQRSEKVSCYYAKSNIYSMLILRKSEQSAQLLDWRLQLFLAAYFGCACNNIL